MIKISRRKRNTQKSNHSRTSYHKTHSKKHLQKGKGVSSSRIANLQSVNDNIKINVKTMTGDLFSIDVSPLDGKKQIIRKMQQLDPSIPFKHTRLFRILPDDSDIKEDPENLSQLQSGNMLSLMVNTPSIVNYLPGAIVISNENIRNLVTQTVADVIVEIRKTKLLQKTVLEEMISRFISDLNMINENYENDFNEEENAQDSRLFYMDVCGTTLLGLTTILWNTYLKKEDIQLRLYDLYGETYELTADYYAKHYQYHTRQEYKIQRLNAKKRHIFDKIKTRENMIAYGVNQFMESLEEKCNKTEVPSMMCVTSAFSELLLNLNMFPKNHTKLTYHFMFLPIYSFISHYYHLPNGESLVHKGMTITMNMLFNLSLKYYF